MVSVDRLYITQQPTVPHKYYSNCRVSNIIVIQIIKAKLLQLTRVSEIAGVVHIIRPSRVVDVVSNLCSTTITNSDLTPKVLNSISVNMTQAVIKAVVQITRHPLT